MESIFSYLSASAFFDLSIRSRFFITFERDGGHFFDNRAKEESRLFIFDYKFKMSNRVDNELKNDKKSVGRTLTSLTMI